MCVCVGGGGGCCVCVCVCVCVSSSRKLSVYHSVNRFTSKKYVSMPLWENSRLRIAESKFDHEVSRG